MGKISTKFAPGEIVTWKAGGMSKISSVVRVKLDELPPKSKKGYLVPVCIRGLQWIKEKEVSRVEKFIA